MGRILPAHIHDTMMACSRKLFNAAQDGDVTYATSAMTDTVETLTFTLKLVLSDKQYQQAQKGWQHDGIGQG